MTSLHDPQSALRPVPRAEGAPCYRVSSFELSSGLEVTALAINSLPADVLRELQRLSDCWDRPSALPQPVGSGRQAFR